MVITLLQGESTPKQLADWLLQRGHWVIPVTQLLPQGLSDDAVVAVASRESLIVLTCDQDFRNQRRHPLIEYLVVDIRPQQDIVVVFERIIQLLEAHYRWCQSNGQRFCATMTRNRYTVYLWTRVDTERRIAAA